MLLISISHTFIVFFSMTVTLFIIWIILVIPSTINSATTFHIPIISLSDTIVNGFNTDLLSMTSITLSFRTPFFSPNILFFTILRIIVKNTTTTLMSSINIFWNFWIFIATLNLLTPITAMEIRFSNNFGL